MSDEPTGDDVPWRRLSVRVVWMDLYRVAVSAVPGVLGTVVLGDDRPVWPLVAVSVLGILGALVDLRRWMTTRYRLTDTQVELRSGTLSRQHRTVPRDRVRSVEATALFRHRLFGLRVVAIGAGESEASFRLDAVTSVDAELLQRELMDAAAGPAGERSTGPAADAASAEPAAAQPTVLARLDRSWVLLNAIRVRSALAVAGVVFALDRLLGQVDVELVGTVDRLVESGRVHPATVAVLVVVVGYLLGVLAAAGAFLTAYWGFELVRTGTASATVLTTRRGLFSGQTVLRDERRVRGLSLAEPLAWRWAPIAELRVLSTGLNDSGEQSSSAILPRVRRTQALAVADRVLPDGERPLEATLNRHPRSALTSRLFDAVIDPALLCIVLLAFIATGALPDRVRGLPVALLPLALLPVTLPWAFVAYRALGHAVTAGYVVVRSGATTWRTVALQRRAVVGWTVTQSPLQRLAGRVSVRVATAAGDRSYAVEDAGQAQGLRLIEQVTPELVSGLLERGPGGPRGAVSDRYRAVPPA